MKNIIIGHFLGQYFMFFLVQPIISRFGEIGNHDAIFKMVTFSIFSPKMQFFIGTTCPFMTNYTIFFNLKSSPYR